MHLPYIPFNKFTFGDIINSAVGVGVYLFASIKSSSETLGTQIIVQEPDSIFLDENIRATYSICIAVTILIISWLIRGVLDDKDAWFTIQLTKVLNVIKFKKKLDKDSIDDIIL